MERVARWWVAAGICILPRETRIWRDGRCRERRAAAMTRENPDEIASYYRDNAVVDAYVHKRTAQPLNGTLHAAQIRMLRRLLAQRRGATVLELAPGPARLTAELPLSSGRGLAVEFSEGMLAAAGQRMRNTPGWTFVRGDGFSLPVRDAAIDFAFTLRFIRRFQPGERDRIYLELHRVLKPGGTLVIDAQNRAVSLPHRRERGLDSYPVFDQLYTPDELRTELENAGFRLLELDGMIRHATLQRRLNRLRHRGLGGVARLLIGALEYAPLGNPSTWMVVCEKRA
jgi:ubiquinone/menaquinone biosynthesis C-methylase UbiE